MAQIIECPACSTRYKINKAIPEAGRNVKCARCAHQWKLTPADALPDDDEMEAAPPSQAEQPWHGQGDPAGAGQDGSTSAEPDHEVQDHSHFHHDESSYESPETAADERDWSPPVGDNLLRSSLSQPVTAAHDDPETEPGQSALSDDEMEEDAPPRGRRSWWQRSQPVETADAGDEQAYPIPSGAYEVPSDAFEADAPYEQAAESGQPGSTEESADVDENWSSRFMGPGWRSQDTAVEEEEDEDPETVIRETFRSALERSDEEEPIAADAPDEGQNASPFGSIYDAEWNRSGDEESEMQAGLGPEPAFRQPHADYDDEPETDPYEIAQGAIATNEDRDPAFYAEDTPAFLRRDAGADEPEPEETYHSETEDYDAYDEDNEDDDRAALARFAPQNGRLQSFDDMDDMDDMGEDFDDGPDRLAGPGEPQDYDAPFGDQFDDAADRRDKENGLDDPLMGLDDEDESRDDEIYGPAPQGSSGLAVAAGWVAYLSLAGGLLLGAVNFRQDVMAVLPGTVNLYRMLGYDVALNKVDFASVDYQWSEIDGRPAIELRGEVVNVTDETVRVPPVMVNVQSSSGGNLRAEASVPTDELGPRDSATFTLELVSPPEDVTRIELEFASGG